MSSTVILAVDLGKTECRAQVRHGVEQIESSGAGAPGLAETGGVDLAIAAIDAVAREALGGIRPEIVSVGAAGALSAPDAAARLAARLADAMRAEVAVTSDVVTGHAGAFHGAAGTLLIAGTGSVAFDLSLAGLLRRAGGWGPWLGDEGSGQWIGRRGLSAVLDAADGRGRATDLTERARQFAPLESLSRWIADAEAPAARMATFAPAVLDLAASGDPVAVSIVDAAVDELVSLVVAARSDPTGSPAAVLGGLTRSRTFLERLRAALQRSGVETVAPAGSALDGAVLIASRVDLAHELQVHRS